jgi:hypothetical protein
MALALGQNVLWCFCFHSQAGRVMSLEAMHLDHILKLIAEFLGGIAFCLRFGVEGLGYKV